MNCFLRPQSLAVIFQALAPWLAFSAVPSLVLESDQSGLKTGGSSIADSNPKALSFSSGTDHLELTSVDLALVASLAGTFQVDFQLYSTTASGAPQTLLYSTSFNPSLTTSSTWYSLPISYTLNPSTTYAFGFSAPITGSASQVKWVNTLVWQPSTGSNVGYEGFSPYGADGYYFDNTTSLWTATGANNNAFRLYAVPETPAGALSGLGLAGFGVYQLRLRWNRRPEGIPERAEHHDGSQN